MIFLLFQCLLFLFIVAEIVIGRRYAKDCPVNSMIPHYLIVTGAVGLTVIILILIQGIVTTAVLKPAMRASESDSRNAGITGGVCCMSCSIVFILLCLSMFVMGWTIAGLVWVFGAWKKVQYIQPEESTYCHPTLYRFTYWLFFLPFIVAFAVCCLCCAPLMCSRLCSWCKEKQGSPTSTNYRTSKSLNIQNFCIINIVVYEITIYTLERFFKYIYFASFIFFFTILCLLNLPIFFIYCVR